jgi:putative MATE family efflux protein
MERDLTQGSIVKNILYMSVPTMMGFIAQTLYDLVDMAWIGRISSDAVAAVTILTSIFWLVEVLNEIIGTSSVSLISQNFGAGNYKQTKICIEQTLTFKMLVSLIAMVLLVVFMKPLIGFFSQEETVKKAALDYGYLRIFFLPIMFSTFSINTALRCIGDSKRPMILMFVTSVINIVLDPVLMFDTIPILGIPGFGLGVFGAALATVISMSVGFVVGLIMIFNLKNKAIRPTVKGIFTLNAKIDKKLITIGLPTGIEVLFRQIAQITILKVVTVFGTVAVAALGIQQRLAGFFIMPLIGLLMGGSTIVGQNMGAEKMGRAEKTTHYAAVLGGIIMSVVTVFVLFFPEQIMGIFVNDPKVIEVGVPMLRIITPSYILLAVAFGWATGFSGAGYNMPFLISAIVARWCVQIPFMFFTIYQMKLPIHYIWISFALSEAAEFAVMCIIYFRGKWKHKRVSHLV